jgi:hypothetical protein
MKKRLKLAMPVLLVCLLAAIFSIAPISAQDTSEGVKLTQSQVTWQTLAYELNANNGIVPGLRDTETIVERTFDTYVLENEYLKVTLLPEYGGRILSIIYKPTGHEELYQNPLGVPYGIGEGNFYYDWLMVYGGIFPTFPEPEHGKTWLLPWDFEVITESPEEVTVAMSIVDDSAFSRAPRKFDTGVTGIEATFYVTLKSGHAALDTRIVLHNPGDTAVRYEYWTCTTLAPGSEPGESRATAGAEIIAPVDEIKMPPWWPDTTAQETLTDTPDVYTFDNLRMFSNWADMGIAYAYPDMEGETFWGVINHDNEEGIIRIANNDVTPGLKMWTWGYDSTDVDPFAQHAAESRPYIELWAGVTPEFFIHTSLEPDGEVVMEDTYSPTLGLTNVTHASRDYLANFYLDGSAAVLQLFSAEPERAVRAVISADSQVIYDMPMLFDPAAANQISVEIPDDSEQVEFSIVAQDDTELLAGVL